MSGTLASLGGAPEIPQNPAAGSAPARKPGCGCLGSVSGAMVLVIGVMLLLNPWSLRMGGRWTPALTWHGVGKLHSTTGATYGLFMELSPNLARGRRGGHGSRQNLEGTAKICTPQGEVYAMTVDGYLTDAWLDADHKPITFYLRSPKDAPPKLRADFYGSWQGRELVLDDKGSMAMSFLADGSAKGYLKGMNAPPEDTTGSLRYAAESEFASVCGERAKSSF
jgi:hypothetical protein